MKARSKAAAARLLAAARFRGGMPPFGYVIAEALNGKGPPESQR